MAPNLAIAIIMSKKYIVEDAQYYYEPRNYLFEIMRAYQDVEITTNLVLTMVIYNSFHLQFK